MGVGGHRSVKPHRGEDATKSMKENMNNLSYLKVNSQIGYDFYTRKLVLLEHN